MDTNTNFEDFDRVYEILEIGRDEFKNLTTEQAQILNEAHVIVQQMEELNAEGIETLDEYREH